MRERARETSFPFHRLDSQQRHSRKKEYRNIESVSVTASQRQKEGWKKKADTDLRSQEKMEN